MQLRFMTVPILSKNADLVRMRILNISTDRPAAFAAYERHAEAIGINFHFYYPQYKSMIPASGADLTQQQQDMIIMRMFQDLDAEWNHNAAQSARPVNHRP